MPKKLYGWNIFSQYYESVYIRTKYKFVSPTFKMYKHIDNQAGVHNYMVVYVDDVCEITPIILLKYYTYRYIRKIDNYKITYPNKYNMVFKKMFCGSYRTTEPVMLCDYCYFKTYENMHSKNVPIPSHTIQISDERFNVLVFFKILQNELKNGHLEKLVQLHNI